VRVPAGRVSPEENGLALLADVFNIIEGRPNAQS